MITQKNFNEYGDENELYKASDNNCYDRKALKKWFLSQLRKRIEPLLPSKKVPSVGKKERILNFK